jgi:hypothetical protein
VAKAHKIIRKVKRIESRPGISLELSEGDADLLLALLGTVHGDGKESPAKYGYRIKRALEGAMGIKATETDAWKLKTGHPRVWFEKYRDPEAGLPRISFGFDADGLDSDGRTWRAANPALGVTPEDLDAAVRWSRRRQGL